MPARLLYVPHHATGEPARELHKGQEVPTEIRGTLLSLADLAWLLTNPPAGHSRWLTHGGLIVVLAAPPSVDFV